MDMSVIEVQLLVSKQKLQVWDYTYKHVLRVPLEAFTG